MTWSRWQSQQRTGHEEVAIEVATTSERESWAVLTLGGHFDAPWAADLLGRVLLDVLLDGYTEVVLDVRSALDLGPAAWRTMVSAGQLYGECDGLLTVSGLGAREAVALRLLDPHGELDLMALRCS